MALKGAGLSKTPPCKAKEKSWARGLSPAEDRLSVGKKPVAEYSVHHAFGVTGPGKT
jgi:hypothetical protein